MSRLRVRSREAALNLETLLDTPDVADFYIQEERDWMLLLAERMFEVNNRGATLEELRP